MAQATGKEVLLAAFSEKEWRRVPSEIARKLESYIGEKFDDLITARARVETQSYNAVHTLADLQSKHDSLIKTHDSLQKKMDLANGTIEELEKQLGNCTADVNKLQANCTRLEYETSELRNARNLLTDERDELNRMVDRRNGELDRLQADINALTKQLEEAIAAKCEVLAKVHEVDAMKLSIEYKEKRMEQERTLLNSQTKHLSDDLEKRTEELLNMRRDNHSRCVQLEIKLTEKSHELLASNESIKQLTDTNASLMTKMTELLEKLAVEKENYHKTLETFEQEVEAQKKIAELYKNVGEEKTQHADELAEAVQELKTKLDEALEKYGDLETKNKEDELAHDEILDKKNQCIAMLKKELDTANELLVNSKQDNLQREVEEMSPSAAAASRLMKPTMTLTEIYKQYMQANESLQHEKVENQRLQSYIQSIIQELEEKGPLIAQQREHYERALETIDEMTKKMDSANSELQQLRDKNSDLKRFEVSATRENTRLKLEIADLSRQICHLLLEVEHSRVGSSSTSTDQDLSDSVCSADIINKRLVTFSDIKELQTTNQRLLALVRELSTNQEENEYGPEMIDNLKMKLNKMQEANAELLEQQEKQASMFKMLSMQRDTYKTLYHQFVKGGNPDDTVDLDKTPSPKHNADDGDHTVDNEKYKELETRYQKISKDLDTTREEFDVYKKEKTANEKIIIEQSERVRGELQEMMRQNMKLSAKIETCDEMLKVQRKNSEVYKTQIERLEERNKIYSESIVKHETAQSYLKDQILDSQTKLSKAEVMLSNLQKENALLREAENRLVRERDTVQREHQSHTIMQTNIELIKATLERNDAESRIRLEETIKESSRECSALRRRLQEEQDHFRQLSEHLEKQMGVVQQRMTEEKECADKLRAELAETREELTTKSQQLEELSKKLKNSLFADIEGNVEARKHRELELLLNNAQSEVESMKQKLKIAKEAVEQHSNVAQAAEKQLIDLHDKHKIDTDAYETKLAERQAKITELEEKCADLQGELSLQNDGQVTTTSNLHMKMSKLELEYRSVCDQLSEAKNQLEEAKDLREKLSQSENKYIKEMESHSDDLKLLRSVKEELKELASAVSEITHERDRANEALEEDRSSWLKQEEIYKKQRIELQTRLEDLDKQNTLLHDQLQQLNTQFSIMQAQVTESHNKSIDLNRSFTDEDIKSSEQLLKIIKYLRQEKDIAVSKCEIMDAEYARIKAQHENLTKQLNEAKEAYEIERQKSEVSVITAAKHSEVLRKVETLNAITDSNRSLRLERDGLLNELNELKTRTTELENQLAPLQEKNKELQNKSEAMQTENITLRGEATRWRQRANMLIEKSNRTSPEDWKKLQGERESLAKQLTIERANTTKLTDDNNNLMKERNRLNEQVKELLTQQAVQKDEIDKLQVQMENLTTQINTLQGNVDQTSNNLIKMTEENRVLTETLAEKDVSLNDVKANLSQIRKIARKYKIQAEEQTKEITELNDKVATMQQPLTDERRSEIMQEGRAEVEERLNRLETAHTEQVEQLNQQISSTNEENEKNKKEIETLKNDLHASLEKEDRFKVLFKNAKERIMKLTMQNNSLIEQLNKDGNASSESDAQQSTSSDAVARLEKEKQDILQEKNDENERHLQEIEALTQRINQLQRQLGAQQGSKPSTSTEKEKTVTEPPTANIKPMAGHNTQTQSVPIQPWRSGSEPPLASIRPMSMQLRTVAVLPTSQSPSTVMVPPQQQVHTTGSGGAEAMSSSPTSSHTEYVPATSSANLALGPRQVAVPPTQSNQDTEDEQVQQPQQQAVALILPRVEPPSSAQEQGTSSSSNTVTTTQASHKRPREADTESTSSHDEQSSKSQPQTKRTRTQGATESVSESGLEVEYQVPTSSQRDHEEDAVIVVESDEEGPDEGDVGDYNMPYEDPDTQDPDQDDEAGNEVEVIEDSSEVPNQSERGESYMMQGDGEEEEECEAPEEGVEEETMQPEATSSGTNVSTSVAVTLPSFSRTRQVTPLLRQQQGHLILQHGIEEGGDDGIVPSTPTLFVTRRDAFGEAISSPHVPTSGRFTFTESGAPSNIGCNDVLPEQTLEMANVDDNSTGRSVPSTPLQTSPHESGPSNEDQSKQGEGDNSTISESGAEDEAEPAEAADCMGPPSVAGTSSGEGAQTMDQVEEMQEGDDRVSSEGEKATATEEGEEEGREAEASPSTNTRSRNLRAATGIARRTPRQTNVRGVSRSGPTPIVWSGDQQTSRAEEAAPRGRGSSAIFATRSLNRRSRPRNQRGSYSGRF